jgi:hypothetical protein
MISYRPAKINKAIAINWIESESLLSIWTYSECQGLAGKVFDTAIAANRAHISDRTKCPAQRCVI